MSLDKTLFKALRAGGLGHKAALLLADPTSKYALSNAGFGGGSAIAEAYIQDASYNELASAFFAWDSKVTKVQGTFPVRAATQLLFLFDRYDDGSSPDPTPSGTAVANFLKLADGAGTPVAPVRDSLVIHRLNNTWTLQSPVSGFTFVTVDESYFGITVAAAGHYAVNATFLKTA